MKNLKIMKVKSEDIIEGDLVLSDDSKEIYIVVECGRTFLHSHEYIKACYPESECPTCKWMIQDLRKIKTICRLV